jgi:hypothetical protein
MRFSIFFKLSPKGPDSRAKAVSNMASNSQRYSFEIIGFLGLGEFEATCDLALSRESYSIGGIV